jgi:hypothetical protein
LLALHLGDGALEYLDELVADDLALALGVGDALELAEEVSRGVDDAEVDLELAAEHLLDLGALVERAAGRCRRRRRSAARRWRAG